MKQRFVIVFGTTMLLASHICKCQQPSAAVVKQFCSHSPGKICGSEFGLEYYELPDTSQTKIAIYSVIQQLGISRKVYIGKFHDKSSTGIFFKLQDNISRVLISSGQMKSKWIMFGILFHELGHYVNDHENFCSNIELELDADYYSGFCLSKAGADSLQALEAMTILPENGDDTHPPKTERIERLLKGWRYERQNRGISSERAIKSFATIQQLVTWRKSEKYIDVKIDGKAYRFKKPSAFFKDSVLSFDPEFGMLYIESTNSSYQFFDYQESSSGLGDLINDVTSLVFLRYDSKHWRLYNKGKIVTFTETRKEYGYVDKTKRDFRTNYYVGDKVLVVILRDFDKAKEPYKKLMPAFYR